MSNQKSEKQIDKNIIYIGVFTIAIIVVIIAIFAMKSSNGNSSTNTANNVNTQATTKLTIVSENGNQDETIKKDINIRKVDFSKTIDEVKAFEKKRKDTLDNPSEATSEDGYTYLSYSFNPEKPATFFGVQVSVSDINAMLTYVFHNDLLIEVRIQYGNVGSTVYNNIVTANNATYGNATYSRSYSNGTQQSWWKTKDVTLDVICQNQSVIAYYRTNNK